MSEERRKLAKILLLWEQADGRYLDSESYSADEILDNLIEYIDQQVAKTERKCFLAGAVFAGMPDEDASIVINAFDEWKAQRGGRG